MLSNKMEITVRHKKPRVFSKTRISFHMKYAHVVSKTLKKPLFQKFLKWMLKRENIEENMITNIQVMTFPFQKKNGKGLAGKCSSEGEIHIYPKRMEFCRKLKQKYGKEKVGSYIKNRARAALIHELLHMKYLSDEEKVRRLTRKYFNVFNRHQNTQNPKTNKILKMLFKQ